MTRASVFLALILAATPTAAQFFPARQFPAGENPLLVDIDQDGIVDIVTTRDFIGGGRYDTLLGVGDGTFVEGQTHYGLDNPTDTVAADFDRDGIDDLATGNSSGGLRMCPGLGGGRFGACTEYYTGSGPGPRSLITGDFNGDGALDVAGVDGSRHVLVLLNNRFGGFGSEASYLTDYGPGALALGDFDQDGALDLVAANRTVRSVSMLMGIGDGTFAPRVDVQVGYGPYDVAVGEFDGDGLLDLAVTHDGISSSSAGVIILLGHGDGTFSDPVKYEVGIRTSAVVVEDFDADGHQDLVVGDVHGNSAWLLDGNGDGTFSTPVPVESGPGSFGVYVGDLDGANGLDLVTGGSYSQESITVLLSDGPAGFLTRRDYPTDYNPGTPAVADFDSDGERDLVYTLSYSNAISLFMGNGDGSFVPSGLVPTGDRPGLVAVGDIDGDGMADSVTLHHRSDEVMTLLGKGDGSFEPGRAYPVGSGPRFLVVDDFDRDGRDDVVSVNYEADSISVLLARPNRSLAPAVDHPVQNQPDSAAAADLDGDDILDLAVIDEAARSSVTILRGVGDGTFTTVDNFETGASSYELAIGDMNEDGKQDLVIPSGIPSPGLVVLLGRGDATFEPEVVFDVDAYGSSVGLYDVDRDSHLDVVVKGQYGQVHVLRGAGDGTFGEPTSYAFPTLHFVVSDFNGDDLADLAGNITSWEQAVSVMLGLKRPPTITIDIRPGSVNPRSPGVIPVVIFGSETFDVRSLDVTTLGFGPNAVAPAHDLSNPTDYADHLEDRNDDGHVDLTVHFRANQSGIGCGANSAVLVGTTFDGQAVEGSDTISTVGCRSPRGPVELRPGGRLGVDVPGRTITEPKRRE